MLFKTTQEVYALVGNGSTLSFDSFSSSIDAAELRFLLPAIGVQLYRRIEEVYNTPAPAWQPGEQVLLAKMQAVVAPLAVLLYIPRADVLITDAGVTRLKTEKRESAYKYQLQNARASYQEGGFAALEALVEYLEANAAAWPEWQQSHNRQRYNRLFIRSGSEFAGIYRLCRPQLDFMALAGIMETVEDLFLRPAIGAHLDSLKAKQISGTLSLPEQDLCKTLKKALAYQTIAAGIPQLQVKMDDSGITFSGFGDSTQDEGSKAIAASANAVAMLTESLSGVADRYMDIARTQLQVIDPASPVPSVSFSSVAGSGSFAF